MAIKNKRIPYQFPDPRGAGPEGLVAIGGVLDSDHLISAYEQGIFPWPHEGWPLVWFSPDPRGILEFSDLHVSSSLQKWMKKNSHLVYTWNKNFNGVIESCQQQVRPNQKGTWITDAMKNAYCQLHLDGHAHSLEVWEENALVAGIYGVQTQHYFSAESMFFKKDNASKAALIQLVKKLYERGMTWMDVQMVTHVSQQFGAKLVSRENFLAKIKA